MITAGRIIAAESYIIMESFFWKRFYSCIILLNDIVSSLLQCGLWAWYIHGLRLWLAGIKTQVENTFSAEL